MILDLAPLPWRQTVDILKCCFDNDVDKNKALYLVELLTSYPGKWPEHVDWTLDIPDSYASWIVLKFT